MVTDERFYLFSDPVERRALRIASTNLDREQSLRLVRRNELPPFPVEASATDGTELRDALWPSSIAPVVVRGRFVDLLVSEGLSGWETYPVELFDRKGGSIPGYEGFLTVGRCGPLIRPADRYRFDPATWDGSDFFRASDNGTTFITARARRALLVANVRNVELHALEEYTLPPYLLGG